MIPSGGRREVRVAAALIVPTSLFYALFIFLLHPPEQFVFSDMLFFAQVGNRLQFDVATVADLLKPIGYPLLMAGSFALTGGLLTVKLLHWLAATATLVLIWRAGASSFGERAGLLTLTAACGHYPFIVLAGFSGPEPLFTALLAGMLYLLTRTRCLTRATVTEASALGFLFGLAFWVKGNIALFGPLLVTWLVLRALVFPGESSSGTLRRFLPPAAAFCVVFVLLLGLHAGVTSRWYGEARLSSPVGGLNFVEGKCDTQMNFDSTGQATLSPLAVQRGPIKNRYWSAPFTDDRFYWRAGIACIADNPGVLFESFRYIYYLFYGNLLWPANTTADAGLNRAYHLYYGVVVVPGLLLALVALGRQTLRAATAPYLLLALTLFIASWLFKSELRYRIPFDVVFLPLAVHGWDLAVRRRLTRAGRGFRVAAGLLVAAAACVFGAILLQAAMS